MNRVEVVYSARDNNIELELRENGVNLLDYSPISRVKVTFDAVASIDSDVDVGLLDWTGNSLIIKAGLASIPVGNYFVKIETWDIDNPNGLVWADDLRVEIKA